MRPVLWGGRSGAPSPRNNPGPPLALSKGKTPFGSGKSDPSKGENDMSRTMRMTALALVALCSLGRAVLAQNEEKPLGQFQGKVNVNEVLLDVLVTDAKGNVIVGLDKNDFVVKENGKPVALTGVTFYSN